MMKRSATMVRTIILSLFFFLLALNGGALAKSIEEESSLGLQSTQAVGEKRVLMVAARFPDITPTTSIEMVKRKVVSAFNMYVAEQSYGLASLNADFHGYVILPSPLSQYKVSQYNNQVDAGRVRKLVQDTMTTLENEVVFSSYDHMLIIPAVHTTAGTGYGMVCYCANPGMLTPIQKSDISRSKGRVGQYETLRSKGGKQFRGGVFVGAENANLGMFAHDYFHALGGIYEGRRFAP
jgi:hypothetical protein